MKTIGILLICLLITTVVPWGAETVQESDYPLQYEVMNTSAVGSWMIGNFCTMAVRDKANNGVAFVLQKRGHGSCRTPDSGAVLHGRRDNNEIRLLMQDAKGKMKVERWPIVGTVATTTPAK